MYFDTEHTQTHIISTCMSIYLYLPGDTPSLFGLGDYCPPNLSGGVVIMLIYCQ